MALRVLGHPEDGARFRPVEVLHAHPASLARRTRHGLCASGPSFPNTIFSPPGPPRPVLGPTRTEGVGKPRENRPSPDGSGRPAHAPRPSEGYAAWSRPSHPHRTKGSRWPRTNSGARLQATEPVATTTAGSAPGSRERRSKTDPSSPSFAWLCRSVRPSRRLRRHRGAEPAGHLAATRRSNVGSHDWEGEPDVDVQHERAEDPRRSHGRRYGEDVPGRSEAGASCQGGEAGRRGGGPGAGRAG